MVGRGGHAHLPAMASPCIDVCRFDEATGWCLGCGMAKPEKKRWKKDRDARAAVRDAVTSVNVVENGDVLEVATAQAALGGSCRVSLVGGGLSISPMASTPM
ncbi:MAG TPA: DUF1289 domain-containing protein [Roseococcus sp.]|nr:DUF1289 domain-containing protein [Roseococcus sp.]